MARRARPLVPPLALALLLMATLVDTQEAVDWQQRFVAAEDPLDAGKLLAENICAAQGMRLAPVTETTELYTCIEPGIVEMLPLKVEVSNHIDLQGLRLPPLDKGKLWIHAAGCTDAAQPPAPCEQRKSGYSIHAVSPSCTFCGEENKYEIDPESACAACLPLYRDTYTTSPFFVRETAQLRIDGLNFEGARTRNRGGFFLIWSAARVQLNYVNFYNNKAKMEGGAIALAAGGELGLYQATFESNYIFPDDRLFAVVLNDIWVQEGANLLGRSDRMAIEGCLECAVAFNPPSPPSPPPTSPPPPPAQPAPSAPPGSVGGGTGGGGTGGGGTGDPGSGGGGDGIGGVDGGGVIGPPAPPTPLTEQELLILASNKKSAENKRIVMIIGIAAGGAVAIALLACITCAVLFRLRLAQRKLVEAHALNRRLKVEAHYDTMAKEYGRKIQPGAFTLSGQKQKQDVEAVQAKLILNPRDAEDAPRFIHAKQMERKEKLADKARAKEEAKEKARHAPLEKTKSVLRVTSRRTLLTAPGASDGGVTVPETTVAWAAQEAAEEGSGDDPFASAEQSDSPPNNQDKLKKAKSRVNFDF
eukprot:jgi/Tetstr1/428951/TSEL_018926.t1